MSTYAICSLYVVVYHFVANQQDVAAEHLNLWTVFVSSLLLGRSQWSRFTMLHQDFIIVSVAGDFY